MRRLLALAVLLAPSLARAGAPPVDMAEPPDMLELPDLTVFPDLTGLPDLTVLPDLTGLPDLTARPDLTGLPDLGAPSDLTTAPADMAMASDLAMASADMPAPVSLSPPRPVSPAKDTRVIGGDVHFEWTPALSSEGLAVRYELEVWTGTTPEGKDALRVVQATQDDGSDGVTRGGLPYGVLSWRVRAVTRGGETSDWSTVIPFTTTDEVRSTVGPFDPRPGDCSVGHRSAAPGGLLALLLLLATALIYRRRSCS